jgi:hypothetical protein
VVVLKRRKEKRKEKIRNKCKNKKNIFYLYIIIMSEKGVLQLIQTDFTRYENYQTRLQGTYKLRLCNVNVLHPSGGGTNDTPFDVDIQQLRGVLDNRPLLSFIQSHYGASVLQNKIDFGEVFINGQFFFSGLNMGILTKLILTFEYEKC